MRYMEYSVRDNAKTSGLARLHDMVTEVKANKILDLLEKAGECFGSKNQGGDDIAAVV